MVNFISLFSFNRCPEFTPGLSELSAHSAETAAIVGAFCYHVALQYFSARCGAESILKLLLQPIFHNYLCYGTMLGNGKCFFKRALRIDIPHPFGFAQHDSKNRSV
jgi:hypothetical protein